jgi:tetratricopeptide (TPR) repeat protein
MLEDGTPPPSSAVVERVCNGVSHSEGYTDSKGYFAIQLGQNSAALEDASESLPGGNGTNPQLSGTGTGGGGMGTGVARALAENRFATCDLRARLGGYRSQSVSLRDHGALENPDVGVILLHRLGEAEATTVTATTLTAPKPARKAFEKGMGLVKKKKPEEAVGSLQEAVNLYPEYASAWYELGKLQVDRGDIEAAHQSFASAAKAEPRWPDPLLQLSRLAVEARDWKETADVTDRVLRLNSFDYPGEFFFNAVAHYNLRHIDAAEKSVRSAQKLDTRHEYPQTGHLLGVILIDRHEYAAAAEQLRNYLLLAPQAGDAATVRKQLADVEQLALQGPSLARTDQQ